MRLAIRVSQELKYTFLSTDPNGNDLTYCIEWEDNSGECVGPYESGTEVKLKHIWDSKGTFIIEVKATDTFGTSSEWNSMNVYISLGKFLNLELKAINFFSRLITSDFGIFYKILNIESLNAFLD